MTLGPEIAIILLFVGLVGGLLIGSPVAFVMIGVALILGVVLIGPQSFLPLMYMHTVQVMQEYTLIAIPLFVFMGVLLEYSGIADRLFESLHLSLGGLKGGLLIVVILVCTVMAATTGIVGSSVVTMAVIALPALINRGYDKAMACGTIMASGTLGILIPPSIMLVVYGPMAGVSVGKLFAGSIIPGLLLSTMYIIYVAVRCHLNPSLGPAMPAAERNKVSSSVKFRMIMTSLVPVMFLILAVLGVIFFGIAAPTEAAAAGALGAMILVAINRKLTWNVLWNTTKRTLLITSMIMLTVVGAHLFSAVFTLTGGSDLVRDFFVNLPVSPWVVFIAMMAVYWVLGFFVEWIGILPILVPLFNPLVAAFGWDPLWYGVCACVVMQTSFLSPPMAPALFYLKGSIPKGIDIEMGKHIIGGVWPYIGIQTLGCALIMLIPQLVLWLPKLLIK